MTRSLAALAPAAVAPADLERALRELLTYQTTALATSGPLGPHVAGVFFAPEATGPGIRLVTAMLRDSRKHREILADPRVAFMCSPGTPERWIQGAGIASPVEDPAETALLYARLVAHAPGAQAFIDRLPVLPVLVQVTHLKVVATPAEPALQLALGKVV